MTLLSQPSWSAPYRLERRTAEDRGAADSEPVRYAPQHAGGILRDHSSVAWDQPDQSGGFGEAEQMIAHAAPIAERKPARQHRHPRAARRTEQTQEQAVETGQTRQIHDGIAEEAERGASSAAREQHRLIELGALDRHDRDVPVTGRVVPSAVHRT